MKSRKILCGRCCSSGGGIVVEVMICVEKGSWEVPKTPLRVERIEDSNTLRRLFLVSPLLSSIVFATSVFSFFVFSFMLIHSEYNLITYIQWIDRWCNVLICFRDCDCVLKLFYKPFNSRRFNWLTFQRFFPYLFWKFFLPRSIITVILIAKRLTIFFTLTVVCRQKKLMWH